MKKIIQILLFINLFVITQAVPSIYPTTLEMKLDSGHGRGSFTIYNTSEKEMKYKVSVKSTDNAGKKSELSKYLKVFPRYMVIPAGEKQVIRVMAKKIPLDSFENKEYRSAISIEELESSIQQKYKKRDKENGITTTINFKYIINMAVYGYIGKMIPNMEVSSFKINKNSIEGRIKNTGNYSYFIRYKLFDINNKVLEEKDLYKILFKEDKDFSIKKIKKAKKIIFLEKNGKTTLYEKQLN